MKAPLLALIFLTTPLLAQQNPSAIACGALPINYSIHHGPPTPLPSAPPPGQALVYVVNTMAGAASLTTKVNIGLDGNWIGGTDHGSYISFSVTPGVHHLCAVYQGKASPMQPGDQTILLRLDAEPNHTYFLHYHAFLGEISNVAFFTPVDQDEGLYLVQSSAPALFTPTH